MASQNLLCSFVLLPGNNNQLMIYESSRGPINIKFLMISLSLTYIGKLFFVELMAMNEFELELFE